MRLLKLKSEHHDTLNLSYPVVGAGTTNDDLAEEQWVMNSSKVKKQTNNNLGGSLTSPRGHGGEQYLNGKRSLQ